MATLKYLWEELKDIWKKGVIRALLVIIIAFILFGIFRWKGLPNVWDTIPIAMFSVVVTAFLFEAPGFKRFLQGSALEVLQNSTYLKTLNCESLDRMLKQIHEIRFGLECGMEKGNLYDFVSNNILKFLNKPYEEELEIEYNIYKKDIYAEVQLNRKSKITVESEKTQKDAKPISFYVTPVPGKPDDFHYCFDKFFLKVNGKDIGFPSDSKKVLREGDSLKFLYQHSFAVSKSIQETVEYKTVANETLEEHLVHQMFRLPAKGFKFRLILHDFGDCILSHKFSGPVEPKPDQIVQDRRRFYLNYDGWMIPGNTLTVYFRPVREVTAPAG
jgi:hypothetical protein